MSVSYRIEIDHGNFYPGGTWRALVYRDEEIVNAFIGGSARLVADEANAAIHWHETDGQNKRREDHSVRVVS